MNQGHWARLLYPLCTAVLLAPMLPALAQAPMQAQASAPASASTPQKLYEKLSPSVWRIVGFDAQKKPYGQGSGIVVAADTIVTNCHVLAQGHYFVVRQDNQSFDATLAYADPGRDICQLQVRNMHAPAVTLGDSGKLAVGQRIYALGNPLGLELTLSDGLISALRKDAATRNLIYIQVTAPISPGSSGGGLFDEDGKLVGITTGGFEKAQNLNLAIPISWLSELPARSTSAGMARFVAERKAAEDAAATAASALRSSTHNPSVSKLPEKREPIASSAGDLDSIDNFRRASGLPTAEANYRKFLTYVLPRAFAVADDGRTWGTYGMAPTDANAPKEPSARAIWSCEREYKQRCSLYAVDNTVVYRPRPR